MMSFWWIWTSNLKKKKASNADAGKTSKKDQICIGPLFTQATSIEK